MARPVWPVEDPQGKPGTNVPDTAPVVASMVRSTLEPSGLVHTDRPAGSVWAFSGAEDAPGLETPGLEAPGVAAPGVAAPGMVGGWAAEKSAALSAERAATNTRPSTRRILSSCESDVRRPALTPQASV